MVVSYLGLLSAKRSSAVWCEKAAQDDLNRRNPFQLELATVVVNHSLTRDTYALVKFDDAKAEFDRVAEG